MNYAEYRRRFVLALDDAADGQDAGDFSGLDAASGELQGVLPVDGGPEFDTLHIVLEFLDGWTDARNHDWLYYEGISQHDWPRLARTIAADLGADRQISDKAVLAHFDFRARKRRPSLWKRLKARLWRGGAVEQ